MRREEQRGSASGAGGKGWGSKDGEREATSPLRGCPGVAWGWPASWGMVFPPSKRCLLPRFPSPTWTCFSPRAREKVWRTAAQGGNEGKTSSGSLGTPGREMKVASGFQSPSVPLCHRARRGHRRPPSGLCFHKSLQSCRITDGGGEERLIPINSQSVINIWASSM